jgi:branched-chain amino acid aminotransferase
MNLDNPILVWKLTLRDSGLAANKYDLRYPASTLDEASKQLPGGAYTTLRTYSRTKVLHIKDHFLRLEESAQKVNAGFQTQAAFLRPVLKQIVHASPYPESRLRLTLDLENEPGCYYVALERLHTPHAEAYQKGVKAISHRMQRENPKAKLTNFLTTASQYRSQLAQDVNEMLMVDQNGFLLEGLSSNLYGVNAGSIWTAEEGVLLGITRGAVLEIAEHEKIPVAFGGLPVAQLSSLDECFITSASRGVLPVVQIDETIIGSGKPGEMSKNFIRLFRLWVERTIEEI